MLAVPLPSERPLNFGSFIAVVLLHLLALQAILSRADTAPAVTVAPPLYVEFIAAPEPMPLQPPEPLPPSPPRPVEKPQPKPLITTAAAPAPNAIEAPPEPVEPEPLPPIEAAPPPAPAAEPVTEPPKFDLAYLNNPAPSYPKAASRMGQEGRVLLEVRVSAEGKVISLRIKKSSGFPRLDEAAMNAVRHWTFKPSMRGDTAVEGDAIVPIDFLKN